MTSVTASLCAIVLFVAVFASADQKIITAECGQNIALTCRAPNKNIMIVEWGRADLRTECVFIYRDGNVVPEHQHPSFKNRAGLQDRQMKDGDVSLILKNVTTADNGTYECRVFMAETQSWELINSTYLRIDPPGPTGGFGEDEEGGSVGLIVGLIVPAVLLLLAAAAVGFVIYRRREQGQGLYHPPGEPQPV